MLTCDWCHKPIYGKGIWGYQLEFAPFYTLALGQKVTTGAPAGVVLSPHLHVEPCKDELMWAIGELLEDREPLETDGPTDDEVAAEEESNTDDPRTGRQKELETMRQARARWTGLDKAERQRLALNALGDKRLCAREIFERVAAELPDADFYRSDIDPVLRALLDAREVDREAEDWQSRKRWRYFARRELDGPIADLERAFTQPDDEPPE